MTDVTTAWNAFYCAATLAFMTKDFQPAILPNLKKTAELLEHRTKERHFLERSLRPKDVGFWYQNFDVILVSQFVTSCCRC